MKYNILRLFANRGADGEHVVAPKYVHGSTNKWYGHGGETHEPKDTGYASYIPKKIKKKLTIKEKGDLL